MAANTTIKAEGLELMRANVLAAFIPVNHKVAVRSTGNGYRFQTSSRTLICAKGAPGADCHCGLACSRRRTSAGACRKIGANRSWGLANPLATAFNITRSKMPASVRN